MFQQIFGSIGSAIGDREAGHRLDKAKEEYQEDTTLALEDFMSVWTGTPPEGYQTWDSYNRGGKSRIGLLPGVPMKNKFQKEALRDMFKNNMNFRDMAELAKLGTKEEQEKWLFEKWGTQVTLNRKYSVAGGLIDAEIAPGATETPNSFAALDEIRAKGGTPSMEQQFAPYIEPGKDALQMLTNAIIDGDMSGFKADPGYEWRKSEGQEVIKDLAASGRIPTAAAHNALLDLNQNMATAEYDKFINRLRDVAAGGYNAFTDLKSAEAHYKGTELNAKANINSNVYGMESVEAGLVRDAWGEAGSALGAGVDMATNSGVTNMFNKDDGGGSSMLNSSVSTTGNMWNSGTANLLQEETLAKYGSSSYR